MVSLRVSPRSALVDEDVAIVIEGLQRYQEVTLAAVLREDKVRTVSYAHYTADGQGTVDVTATPSTGGTYEGVEPMGFIWSLRLTADQQGGMRLMKRNVQEPMRIDLRVYSGHMTVDNPDSVTSECIASTSIERWYMGKDVERIDIREGRIIATMFVPKGKGPYPGVLDLFGTIGGLVEYRSSLLASRGFVTMSLAYYWPPDKMIDDLEYFEEALDIMWRHPKVLKTGLGVIGVSKGAELANLISIISPKVRAVVPINGPPVTIVLPMIYKGETFYPHAVTDGTMGSKGYRATASDDIKVTNEILFPLERSRAKFLFIHGSDDGVCPPLAGPLLTAKMAALGRGEDCTTLLCEGAGHLIEPPHSPHFGQSYHKQLEVMFDWGGEAKLHARAQELTWAKIQDFLRSTLTSLPEQSASKL